VLDFIQSESTGNGNETRTGERELAKKELPLINAYLGGQLVGLVTHKNPRQRMAASNNFCLRGSCRDLIAGKGNRKTQKSVVMFIDAATYHIFKLSTQRLARLGMKMGTGIHAKGAMVA